MSHNKIAIKITGPAGYGIKMTGIVLAKTLIKKNFHTFAYTEYPSLIRGGHNTYQIDFSGQPINSSKEKADVFVFLDEDSFRIESEKVAPGAIVICDSDIDLKKISNISFYKKNKVQIIQSPLKKMAEFAGTALMKNTVTLGIIMSIFDMNLRELDQVLEKTFAQKGEAKKQNIIAAKSGYDWAEENIKDAKFPKLKIKKDPHKKLLVSGNQACSLATIASGCQIYVAYPMTPASEILHFLEDKQAETGMLVHQPEDEIAAIHVAMGASFTGAKAACGTSGGGFALMNEGLSMLGNNEIPLVIFEVMRPAPATGNPTWSEQGDLLYVINAGHGEFPKAVLTPGDPAECFDLTQRAFNMAEEYQIPTIVLTDKNLGETSFTVADNVFEEVQTQKSFVLRKVKANKKGELFARYKIDADGISDRTVPGVKNGEYICNSDEHDIYGYSDESSQNRKAQMDKRMRKLAELKKEIPLPKVYGPKNAKNTLVCWGSVFGPAKDALDILNKKSKNNFNLVHFSYVWPLPNGLDKFLKKFKKLILVENNQTGQLGQLIRQETGINIKDRILKYDSRPFWTEEIAKLVKK